MDCFLVVQQNLNSLNKLLVNGVKEGVLGLHFVLQEDLHHLQVLVVDGHEEGSTTERVDTVNVDGSIVSTVLEHPEDDTVREVDWTRDRILLFVATSEGDCNDNK